LADELVEPGLMLSLSLGQLEPERVEQVGVVDEQVQAVVRVRGI
jgi:hypothetical protein